jgi:hypothetical protein
MKDEQPPRFSAKKRQPPMQSAPGKAPNSASTFIDGVSVSHGPRRLLPCEAEYVRATFYSWQRDQLLASLPEHVSSDNLRSVTSSMDDPSLVSYLTSSGGNAASPTEVVKKSPSGSLPRRRQQDACRRIQTFEDVDSFLFLQKEVKQSTSTSSPGSPVGRSEPCEATQCANLSFGASSSSPARSLRKNTSVNSTTHAAAWVHRATMKGSSTAQVSLCYDSPQHIVRSLEAQLAHVGRLDAAQERRLKRKSAR